MREQISRGIKRIRKWLVRLTLFEKVMLVTGMMLAVDFLYMRYETYRFEQSVPQKLYKQMESYIAHADENETIHTQSASAFLASVTPKTEVFMVALPESETGIVARNGESLHVVKKLGSSVTQEGVEKALLDKEVNFVWVRPPVSPSMHFAPLFSSRAILLLSLGMMLYVMIQSSGIKLFDRELDVIYPEQIEGGLDEIIGYEEIKQETIQLLEIMTRKHTYARYGIEGTFNILFSGRAGTGKSKFALYLAKALDVPIVATTGSLDEIYVGSGAKKIRTLFANAQKAAKHSVHKSAIVFIDEAQKLLRKRGVSKEERWADDTANELLAYLDGVHSSKEYNIIVIMASNFTEGDLEMDEAMLRRFQKKIYFRPPNFKEREAILLHYLEKVEEKEENMLLGSVVRQMSGMTPAFIETVVKEAALLALREGRRLNVAALMQALELTLLGRSSRETGAYNEKMRKIICVHEIGHFLIGWDRDMQRYNGDVTEVESNSTLVKISSEEVSQRGALGFVMTQGGEAPMLRTIDDLEWEVRILYGGLAAERVIFGRGGSTTGAADDLKRVTQLLQYMVVENAVYEPAKLDYTQLKADEMMQEQLERRAGEFFEEAYDIIEEHRDLLTFLSQKLMEEWSMDKKRIFTLIAQFMEERRVQFVIGGEPGSCPQSA